MGAKATSTLMDLNSEAIERSRQDKAIHDQMKLARKLADEAGKVNVRPVSGRRLHQLSDEERMQCAHDYFLSGSLVEVSKKHNVLHGELFEAARQAWWQMEVSSLQRESTLMMKSKLTRIMDLTLDQLEDRVNNGDVQFDRRGESYRCPISAQTLAAVANVIFDKKLKLEDRSSGFVEGENKRLIDLANSLTMMGAKAVEVIDAEVIDDDATDDVIDEGNENG